MLTFHVYIQSANPHGGLRVTFDAALASLARLPRLFIEPDGSFVWTESTPDDQSWQVDGNLIDRGDVLDYVEAKGHCPQAQFDALLSALGWPEAKLAFQLPQRGIVLAEAEFRQLAATNPSAR